MFGAQLMRQLPTDQRCLTIVRDVQLRQTADAVDTGLQDLSPCGPKVITTEVKVNL